MFQGKVMDLSTRKVCSLGSCSSRGFYSCKNLRRIFLRGLNPPGKLLKPTWVSLKRSGVDKEYPE